LDTRPDACICFTSQDREKTVRWARELSASGITVCVGLMQVNAERTGYSTQELLDPCSNLKLGLYIFAAAYRRKAGVFGVGQRALLAALGTYNAGSQAIGFKNGYVSSILRNSQ
jgi:type IV secretion system protein VirB1